MKQIYRFFVAAIALLAVIIVLVSAAQSKPANAQQGTPSATSTDSAVPELPDNTPPLILSKPITATLDPNSSIQFYTFTGKAQDKLRVDLEPASGSYYVTLTVMTTDLQTILGGTLGGNLLGASLAVQLPQDGTYAISIASSSTNGTTPPTGSYQLSLSPFVQK